MGNGTERVPPEGTWARLIYDLRRVERVTQSEVQAGRLDPRSPNYRPIGFGWGDVDYSVLTQGRDRKATAEEIARRQQYAEIYGANIGNQATGPGKETNSPPVTQLSGRQMGSFWDRNQIRPTKTINYDPLESFNAWQSQQRSEKFAAPDWWMEMYGSGATGPGSNGTVLSNPAQERYWARQRAAMAANPNYETPTPGGIRSDKDKEGDWVQPSHDRGKPADLSWIENYGVDWRGGRDNPYGLSEVNTERYEKSGGKEAGAMNRYGQPLGTEAPINAFSGSNARRSGKRYGKKKMLASYGYKHDGSGISKNEAMERYNRDQGKMGAAINSLRDRNRRAAKGKSTGGRGNNWGSKGSGGAGNKFTNPPNRTEGGAYARPNDLINWTW